VRGFDDGVEQERTPDVVAGSAINADTPRAWS
jgi:hypothetical protein